MLDRGEDRVLDGTLRKWVRQVERAAGRRPGLTSQEAEQLKALERENQELRRANEILRKASAFFAQVELFRERRTRAPPSLRSASQQIEVRCARAQLRLMPQSKDGIRSLAGLRPVPREA